MNKAIILLVSLLYIQHGFSQVRDLNLASVPENVKLKANVIKRYENILFEVTDIDRAYLSVDKIITVTGIGGKDELEFTSFTNKYIELEDAEIKVFDSNGKQLNKYKKKDMNTVANGGGLIEDGKITYYTVTTASYPVTVEYTYKLKYKGTLRYPSYNILSSGEGVESSTFTAKVPKDLDLRFKEINTKLPPEIVTDDKYKFYKWSVKNLSPVQYEEGAVSFESRYPAILLAPNKFKLYDYDGDMTSWQKFGLWENELIQGLSELPDHRKTFFTTLVKDAKDDKEKINLVYRYLQKNFRYVSIQIGIGGYKPFPALFTDQNKYGDCKGLSFYMYSVLHAIGIKSYVALINAEYNKEPVDPNFPCSQFNHMILCVPQQKDTVWLECTSNTNDFGVLGNSTENRNALLITEKGGFLVSTPRSKSSDNIFSAHTTVSLQEDGSGKTTTAIKTTGEYKQDILNDLLEEKKDDQKTFLVNTWGFKQPDIFSVTKKEDGNQFTTNIDLEIEKIPDFINGSKMFLSPRMYRISIGNLPKAEARKQDFYFPCPFEKNDTTVFILPNEYGIEGLPESKKITCSYGTYASNYWYNKSENSVYSSAKLVLFKYKIPGADYAVVKQFFDDIQKEDTQRIIVKKQ